MDDPWPVNILKFHRHTGEMQPGDKMVISVMDEGVKNSLLLILSAMPEVSFGVSATGSCYEISITKHRPRIAAKESQIYGRN